MSGEKCTFCSMMVLNMEVHIKLNHKKNKSTKTEGFRFTGIGPSTSTAVPVPLPSITKYQNTQYKYFYKTPKERSNTSDKSDIVMTPQSSSSCNDYANHDKKNNEDCLQKNLAMLSNLLDQETARQLYKLDDVADSDMNDIFKSGRITKEGFEMKLRQLGMIRIGNTYKKKKERSVKYCPDCGEGFHWVKQRKGENREYFDHIKTCGIESSYSKETYKNKTPGQMSEIEPEINMYVKQEIEIKLEDGDALDIVVKNETVDTNDVDLEARYGEQLMLKKLQMKRGPIERLEPNFKNIISSTAVESAVKNEPENADTSNIEVEARYGENLMMNKLEVKIEPVYSFEPEISINTEVMTKVKTEKELKNNFETSSLELRLENTEESFDDPEGMLDVPNLNVLDELVKDNNTQGTGAPIDITEKDPGDKSKTSTSQTENIGDAWFKKISEIEKKTFTCGTCLSSFKMFGPLGNHQRARHGTVCGQCSKSFNAVKKLKNSVTKTICKPRKRQRKRVMKPKINKYLLQ